MMACTPDMGSGYVPRTCHSHSIAELADLRRRMVHDLQRFLSIELLSGRQPRIPAATARKGTIDRPQERSAQ